MKKRFRILSVLRFTAVFALLLAIFVAASVLTGGSLPAFFSGIAERIPGLNAFVVKDYESGAFAVTRAESSALKVARYDVDFLASFTGSRGRFVALYPFTVVAEVDLSRARRVTGKRVELPYPTYRAHLDQDKSRSRVLMDTLSPDYDAVIAPVLAAYQAKALDYARADAAFMASSVERAASYVGALFPGCAIEWVGSRDASLSYASELVPAEFRYGTDGAAATAPASASSRAADGALADSATLTSAGIAVTGGIAATGGSVKFAPSTSLRDDLKIESTRFGDTVAPGLRFGVSGYSTADFASFVRSARAAALFGPSSATAPSGTSIAPPADRLLFRYHNPIDPDSAVVLSFVDDGYRTAWAYLSGGDQVYYVDAPPASGINDEYRLKHIAPNVLYFAASLAPSANRPPLADDYRAYLASHEFALSEARAGRYGRLMGNAVAGMETAARACAREDGDAKLFRELLDLGGASLDALKVGGYRGTVGILEALAAADYARLGSLMRAESEGDVRNDREANANLQALFWVLRKEIGIPDAESDAYRRDLVANGATVSPALVASLSDADRNALYGNFFRSAIGADYPQLLQADPADATSTWFFYGAGSNAWIDKRLPHELTERLDALGVERANRFTVIFADPPERSGFFTAYHALVFDAGGVTVCRDLTAWIRLSGAPVRVPFAEIEVSGDSFAAAGRDFRNVGPLAGVLARFHDAWSSPDWNREELTRFIRDDLVSELSATLSRPVLPLAR